MSDLNIMIGGIGTGVAVGALAGIATRSAAGAAVGLSAGMAAGGLATWSIQRAERLDDSSSNASGLLHPASSIGALGGAALGGMLSGMITSTSHFEMVPRTQNAAIVGASLLLGAAVGAAVISQARTS